MAKATKFADKPHARIYQSWLALPAWRAMRIEAQLLLVHMLAEFRPANNSRLEWTLTRVQQTLNCSRTIASECLTDLEKNGWVKVARVGQFSGSRKPSLYRLTWFASEAEDLPATKEFLQSRNPPRIRRKKNLTGSNKTPPKSLLKPEQVPVETDARKISACEQEKKSALTYGKDATSPPGATFEPIPLGSLATQLLLEAEAARRPANDGGGAAREALRSAAPPPLAPQTVRYRSRSNGGEH
jgi:hypothetical protein